MAKSGNSRDKLELKIVSEELIRFNELINLEKELNFI